MKFFLICFLGMLFAGCKREKSDLIFGSVELRTRAESILPISLSPNQQKSPWRLRFRCMNEESGKLFPADKIVLYLYNNDLKPLIFTLDPDSPNLTIPPLSKVKIFEGEIEKLISNDRSMDEKMAFESSRDKHINAKLIFNPEISSQTLSLSVSTFFYREGM
jgi:hypothetical protein